MQNLNNNFGNITENKQIVENKPPEMQNNSMVNNEKYRKEMKEKQIEDEKKIKKKKEKMQLESLLKNYKNITSLGKEKFPKEIHYSKLLIDEKKKRKEKQGSLYIQRGETQIDFIENIKEKFSIDENLFISTDYDIETLEEEETSESNMVKDDEEKKEKKTIKKPQIFLNATYETIIKSFKNSNIPEKYHKILSVLNLSYEDYNNFNKIFNFEIKNDDINIMFSNMIEYVKTTLIEKVPNIKKITNLNNSLKKFLDSFKKTKNYNIGKNEIIIPDDFSLFMLFHNLLIEKSFWMLIPGKNREFLLFLIERILEIVDERNSKIKYYITENDAKESEKENNFQNVIKKIINNNNDTYIQTIDKEFMENFIKNNNLDEEEGLIENHELKILPDRKYHDKHSFSQKWEKIKTTDKIDIFNIFSKLDDKENLVILLISTGSKGVIQYLLISALLIIHNQKKVKKFSKFLTEKQPNGFSLIQNITNDFKQKLFITTGGFETNTKEPYQRFLEFVWAEFQTLHAKTKKELKKEKQEQTEAVQKHYEDIRFKKARQQEADYNIKQRNKGL